MLHQQRIHTQILPKWNMGEFLAFLG